MRKMSKRVFLYSVALSMIMGLYTGQKASAADPQCPQVCPPRAQEIDPRCPKCPPVRQSTQACPPQRARSCAPSVVEHPVVCPQGIVSRDIPGSNIVDERAALCPLPAGTTTNVSTEIRQYRDGKETLVRVINPKTTPVVFKVDEYDVRHVVDPLSDQTFYVDMNHVMDTQLAYTVDDMQGQQLASGIIRNDLYQESTIALDSIINYSTAYTAPTKPAPVYQELPVRYPVRGFW